MEYILVATNQDVLLFKLLNFFGVLLTEACYCLRLYGTYDKCMYPWYHFPITVKLGFKEWLNKEQLGNSEPFLVTNMPVHLSNSEQIGFIEQLCDGKKVPKCHENHH